MGINTVSRAVLVLASEELTSGLRDALAEARYCVGVVGRLDQVAEVVGPDERAIVVLDAAELDWLRIVTDLEKRRPSVQPVLLADRTTRRSSSRSSRPASAGSCGIGLGDHLLAGCEESLSLLQGVSGPDGESSDPAFELAGQLLAAELNLTAGARTCPVADEVVVGAHLLLSTANFDGISTSPLDAEAGGATPRLIDLLAAYNAGELCR